MNSVFFFYILSMYVTQAGSIPIEEGVNANIVITCDTRRILQMFIIVLTNSTCLLSRFYSLVYFVPIGLCMMCCRRYLIYLFNSIPSRSKKHALRVQG